MVGNVDIAANDENAVAPRRPRLRVSIYAIMPPFYKGAASDGTPSVDLDAINGPKGLQESNVDDVTLVYTMCFNELGGTSTVRWSSGFLPGTATPFKETYIQRLISAFRDNNRRVQLLLGYAMCHRQATDAELKDTSDAGKRLLAHIQQDQSCDARFCALLATQDAAAITGHASDIVDVCTRLDADGIAFDIEVPGLTVETHGPGLAMLFLATADKLAATNRIMTYANGPFDKDGRGRTFSSSINAQPYALARGRPNMIARPMCYGSADAVFGDDMLEKGVACAFRAPDPPGTPEDQKQYGGGIDETHLQYVIPHEKVSTQHMTLLRSNGMGLVCYALAGDPKSMFAHCAAFNAEMNGDADKNDDGALIPGKPGQPLQAPNPTPSS